MTVRFFAVSGACARWVLVRTHALAWLAGVAVALSGCASMTPEECRTADWYERGMYDGLQGEPRAYIEEHRAVCAKAGVKTDVSLWQKGRMVGIRQYCQPDNAEALGLKGRTYQSGACPPEMESAFLQRYRAGKRVYDAEQRVQQLVREQRAKERDLENAREDHVRKRLRQELRDLDRRLRSARDDVDYEEQRLRR